MPQQAGEIVILSEEVTVHHFRVREYNIGGDLGLCVGGVGTGTRSLL